MFIGKGRDQYNEKVGMSFFIFLSFPILLMSSGGSSGRGETPAELPAPLECQQVVLLPGSISAYSTFLNTLTLLTRHLT